MQSRPEVVPLRQGDAVAFAVHHRPVRGTRGTYRVNLRHGVSRLRSGQRHTVGRSEEHTSELQSHLNIVCRLLLEKKKTNHILHNVGASAHFVTDTSGSRSTRRNPRSFTTPNNHCARHPATPLPLPHRHLPSPPP